MLHILKWNSYNYLISHIFFSLKLSSDQSIIIVINKKFNLLKISLVFQFSTFFLFYHITKMQVPTSKIYISSNQYFWILMMLYLDILYHYLHFEIKLFIQNIKFSRSVLVSFHFSSSSIFFWHEPEEFYQLDEF